MFQFEGQLYMFVCLPDELTSAPRLFTKILKPIFEALHKEGNEIKMIQSYLLVLLKNVNQLY